jgi:hypothetical protein
VEGQVQHVAAPPRGLEDADRDDYVMPRVQIAQALSPELQPDHANYIDGLKAGEMFNTVTREVYGRELMVIPVLFTKSRILFKPREVGGGIRCLSMNGLNGGTESPTCETCKYSQWGSGKDGQGIACTEIKNYPSMLLREDGGLDLASVTMKSSQVKVSKRWNMLIRLTRKDAFANVYRLKTVKEKGAKGDYYNYNVELAGMPTNVAQYTEAAAIYESLKSKTVHIDVENNTAGEESEF